MRVVISQVQNLSKSFTAGLGLNKCLATGKKSYE